MKGKLSFFLLLCFGMIANDCVAQASLRKEISLNQQWLSEATDSDSVISNIASINFDDKGWKKVDVPHNWDKYEGYRRLRHGNKHGTAWYRKRFQLPFEKQLSKRYFLEFEGVGSYATIWLNGKQVGYHAGGRTSFTIDVTNALQFNHLPNLLAVKAEHPAFIQDLPWVCGGCSDERGFSEGSQPMGIFRPVQLLITNSIRIQPFGVHVWNDSTVSEKRASVFVSTEIKNHSGATRAITVIQHLYDAKHLSVANASRNITLKPGEELHVPQSLLDVQQVHLWDPDHPYLYSLQTQLVERGVVLDDVHTAYGIRSIYWSSKDAGKTNQFFINGKPIFINGIAEYEHLMGNSHAFSDEQVKARVLQMKAVGFNAFRDGHQPHNLLYGHYWDSLGVLWWTQMSAHIWYDTPAFREQFKTLLKEWVKERRNSPSVALWGLQNESKLPEDFAKECSDIIRAMDPTASSQRLITTCNGGSGTDWDVPQNWTGTYGGDPDKYAEDVKRQVLIGEYGAWRTIDLHTEGGYSQDSILSEDRMTALMEKKVYLANKAKDSAAGHFFWLFNSHDNPGRVQGGEGYRELDRIGPVNYKGLLTNWEEPTDVYYMYQSNFTSAVTHPMAYIVSHTWPGRWQTAGVKSGIIVYSNCDEVELFNDVGYVSLGKKKRAGTGTHFEWDAVNIQNNVLYAVGYVNGKAVAKDFIVLDYLPKAPHFDLLFDNNTALLQPAGGFHYLYRVNCGGDDYKDVHGNTWRADRHQNSAASYGSVSWANAFEEMPPYFASQRRTHDPVAGTVDWPLFQQFRYGRDALQFEFPLPNGEYRVELYFMEPWIGKAGGIDGKGWRLFDVAINNTTVLRNVDLWKEAGHDKAVKKVVNATVTNGVLRIYFPNVPVGQAVISAIAIASKNGAVIPAPASQSLVSFTSAPPVINYKYWLDNHQQAFTNDTKKLVDIPPVLYGAEWLQLPISFNDKLAGVFNEDVDLYVALPSPVSTPAWLNGFDHLAASIVNTAQETYTLYKKRFQKGSTWSVNEDKAPINELMVFINHASNMQPAYDLKQMVSYKAADAAHGAALKTQMIAEKPMIVFSRSVSDTLVWHFETGVADIYSLTIKYNNPNEEDITGAIQLMSADGTVLKTEEVHFSYTRPGKWNYINSTSGSMINAGNYKLQLLVKDGKGLILNSLEVQ